MRYERKYLYKKFSHEFIKNRIKSIGFNEAFPKRTVSSIYYDTPNFYLYNISEAGISDRAKIRVRWYNNNPNVKLEYKIKKGEIGNKIIEDISSKSSNFPLSFNSPLSSNKLDLSIPKTIDHIYFPQVAVTYDREYFFSESDNTRLTLDHNIHYSRLQNFPDKCINSNWIPSEDSVVELKYDQNVSNENLFENIMINISLNISRFSKYCQAIYATCG